MVNLHKFFHNLIDVHQNWQIDFFQLGMILAIKNMFPLTPQNYNFLRNISLSTLSKALLRYSKIAHTASPLSNVDRTPSKNLDKAKMVEWPSLKPN